MRSINKLLVLPFFFVVFFLSACGNDNSSSESSTLEGLNVVVSGKGYFVFKDENSTYYLRQSSLHVDHEGFLVDGESRHLQIYPANSDQVIHGVPGSLNVFDSGIDQTSAVIDSDGMISSSRNNIKMIHGQIALADFIGNYFLNSPSTGVYKESEASGPPNIITAGYGLGTIVTSANTLKAESYDDTLDLQTEQPASFAMESSDGNLIPVSEILLFSDKDGLFVDDKGNRLLVRPISEKENVSVVSPVYARKSLSINPQATSNVVLAVTLDSSESRNIGSAFDPSNSSSFHFKTGTIITDSLGNSHDLSFYFIKTETPNEWELYSIFDSQHYNEHFNHFYNPLILLDLSVNQCPTTILLDGSPLDSEGNPNGAALYEVKVELCPIAEFSTGYQTVQIESDGYTTGLLKALVVDECGILHMNFTQGPLLPPLSIASYQLALTNETGTIEDVPCSQNFGVINGDIVW